MTDDECKVENNTLVNGIFFDTGMLENVPAESVEVTTRSGNAIFTLSDMPIEMQATVLPYAATNKDVSWSAEALDSEKADRRERRQIQGHRGSGGRLRCER